MNIDSISIEPLKRDDIPNLADFAPPEWNSPLNHFLDFHFGQDYFQAYVSRERNRIAGTGSIILNGESGWLGNIIVAPEFRRFGLGTRITEYLLDRLKQAGCIHRLLVATAMGEPVYRRLGFQTSMIYRFYQGKRLPGLHNPAIRTLAPSDFTQAIELDRRISGERRDSLLSRFLSPGWAYRDSDHSPLRGIFLPSFAMGWIIATDEEAGLALLHFKHSREEAKSVVPEANTSAIKWLIENHFHEYLAAPRMHLGPEVPWLPHLVFSRASGWCG